jgi:hypothetical protein
LVVDERVTLRKDGCGATGPILNGNMMAIKGGKVNCAPNQPT